MIRDHREHLPVLCQHVHAGRGHPASLRPRGQPANQHGTDAVTLPRIGYHHADVCDGSPGGCVRVHRHGVADDRAILDRDDNVDVVTATRQDSEHGGALGASVREKPEVAASWRQGSEEFPDRVTVAGARPPYAWLPVRRVCLRLGLGIYLGSGHVPSIDRIAESVNWT